MPTTRGSNNCIGNVPRAVPSSPSSTRPLKAMGVWVVIVWGWVVFFCVFLFCAVFGFCCGFVVVILQSPFPAEGHCDRSSLAIRLSVRLALRERTEV